MPSIQNKMDSFLFSIIAYCVLKLQSFRKHSKYSKHYYIMRCLKSFFFPHSPIFLINPERILPVVLSTYEAEYVFAPGDVICPQLLISCSLLSSQSQ